MAIESRGKSGFHNATCYLPEYSWEDVNGYSDAEMDYFKEFVRNNAHLMIEFSKNHFEPGAGKENFEWCD